MTERKADYWFKPRRYGYGAAPVTWQGWATIVAFLVLFPLVALALMWAMPNVWGLLAVVIFIPLAIFGFIAFVRTKTDGEWRWQWGDRAQVACEIGVCSKDLERSRNA